MLNNIISYFTKDITDQLERSKYTFYKDRLNIIIYYDRNILWSFSLLDNWSNNYKQGIYKQVPYLEDKTRRYFINKDIYINRSSIILYYNKKRGDVYFSLWYNIKYKSYLIKNDLRYQDEYYKELLYNILYYGMYIYKYYNIDLYFNHIKYYKPLIFISNKYELNFYSKLFVLF